MNKWIKMEKWFFVLVCFGLVWLLSKIQDAAKDIQDNNTPNAKIVKMVVDRIKVWFVELVYKTRRSRILLCLDGV